MTERIYKFDFFNPQDRNDVIEFLKQYFKQDLERAMRYLSQTPVRANKEDEGINEDSAAYSLLRQKQDFEEKLKATKDENKKVNAENESLRNQIGELKETVERYQKSASKHDQKMQDKAEEIRRLNERLIAFEKQLNEAKANLEKNAKEAQEKLEEERKNHQAEIDKKDSESRELQRNYLNRENELKKELEQLKSRLSEYEPDLGAEVGDEKLYQIDEYSQEPTLIETKSSDAPYIVQIAGNGKARFRFNSNALPLAACRDRESVLLPFCEIIEGKDNENANTIINAGDGIAQISSIDQTISKSKIQTLAKIRLIKI